MSASSSDPDFPASNANDGDPETSWYSDYAQGLPQWWQVDFGETYTITKVLIDWDQYRIDFLDYSLAVSDDGVTFTDVVHRSRTGATNSAVQTVETFTARGRYLRLTVTDAWYDCSGTCSIDTLSIKEFQAFNVPVVPDDQLNPPERCPCNAQDQTNNPVNTHTGAFWTSHTDLELASPGPNLAWSRTYNSRNITETTLLGPGWQHAYAARLITAAMPEGEDGFVVIVTPKGNRFRFADNGDGTFTTLPGIYDTLSQGSGVYTQTLRDQSQYVFSATTGRLITIRDPQGRALTLSYDPIDGRLLEIADALAPERKLVLGYNTAHDRITSVSDGVRTVSYEFDGQGDLTTVTDVMGRPTTYEYWEHRITAILDSFGEIVESMSYELQLGTWRVTYQQLQDGRQLWFSYSAEATTITIRSASWSLLERQVIHYGPDSTKTGNSVNGVTVRGSDYDDQFAPGVTVDGNGNTTTSDYNDAGQPLSITNALGQTTEAAYDALNRPVVITDTLGRRTEMAYDLANNLISQTTGITATFLGFTTVYTYNVRYPGKNWLEDTVSPDGVRTRYEYDALGQRTAITQNYVDGAYSQSAPDEDLRTTYGYDSFGRVVTTTVGVGTALQRMNVTEYNFDNTTGRTIQNYVDGVSNASAPDEDLITTYGYDDLGRQVWVRDALGRYDVTHYDLDGRVDWTAQNLVPFQVDTHNLPLFQPFSPAQPDRNVATRYAYDQLGRTSLITQTGLLTGTFDPATRTFSSATSRTTRTEYDSLSRPITVTLNYQPGVLAGPDVNVQTLRQYDTAGNLVWERDALGRWVHMAYDALNRPVTVTVNVENGDPLTVDAANAS